MTKGAAHNASRVLSRKPKADRAKDANHSDKWSPNILKAGWVMVPSILLEKQHALGMGPSELNVLLQILRYWWVAESLPYPSKKSIASAIGCSSRTVQRAIGKLKGLGLDVEERKKPNKTNLTNRYSVKTLVKTLEPYAIEAIEQRAKQKKERKERKERRGKTQIVR